MSASRRSQPRHGGTAAAVAGRPPSAPTRLDPKECCPIPGQTIADIGEFALIRRIADALAAGPAVPTTLLGPGDDAAVVAAPDGRVVATTDVLVEGTHFRTDWSSAEDVGHKAAVKNFADIAAMGAVPTSLLVGFGAPPQTELRWVDGFVAGLREACGAMGAAVVGGDVVRSPGLIIAATALGDLRGHAAVTLDGARAGDVVAVAGRLGWAAAGFAVLSRGFRSPVQMVAAHRRPDPPLAAGPAALEAGASAMTDVSDGLLADLGNIAAASGVGIDIVGSALSIEPKLAEVAAALNVDPLGWVLTGGDDYALAATFPPEADLTPPWRVIGSVRARAGASPDGGDIRVDGRRWPQGGHEHFR